MLRSQAADACALLLLPLSISIHAHILEMMNILDQNAYVLVQSRPQVQQQRPETGIALIPTHFARHQLTAVFFNLPSSHSRYRKVCAPAWSTEC